jgi:hypothetical protein
VQFKLSGPGTGNGVIAIVGEPWGRRRGGEQLGQLTAGLCAAWEIFRVDKEANPE